MAVFYSPHPANYEADFATCSRLARAGDTVTLHAHHEWDGALPRAAMVPCNESCTTFHPPRETDATSE